MKVYGLKSEYKTCRKNRTRKVYSYGLKDIDGVHATWHEVVFYKKMNPYPTFLEIQEAILTDINDYVKSQIIECFTWSAHSVWLSLENQTNYKNALDIAIQGQGGSLPMTFRFGTDTEPDYVTFNTIEELLEFYNNIVNHIDACRMYGWDIKDHIDWDEYK